MPVTCHCVCAQWLQRIEETESALQRKMVDLESEKVSGAFPGAPEADVTRSECLRPRPGPLCFRSCSVSRKATWMRSWITGSRPWTKPTR